MGMDKIQRFLVPRWAYSAAAVAIVVCALPVFLPMETWHGAIRFGLEALVALVAVAAAVFVGMTALNGPISQAHKVGLLILSAFCALSTVIVPFVLVFVGIAVFGF